jgi:hypothetical protein
MIGATPRVAAPFKISCSGEFQSDKFFLSTGAPQCGTKHVSSNLFDLCRRCHRTIH